MNYHFVAAVAAAVVVTERVKIQHFGVVVMFAGWPIAFEDLPIV